MANVPAADRSSYSYCGAFLPRVVQGGTQKLSFRIARASPSRGGTDGAQSGSIIGRVDGVQHLLCGLDQGIGQDRIAARDLSPDFVLKGFELVAAADKTAAIAR